MANSLFEDPQQRIATDWDSALAKLDIWRQENERIVFTNGCFDLLHPGHVTYLAQARQLGDRLVVGLNADLSVKRLKGADRPLQCEEDRAFNLAGLRSVDLVVLFTEDTPLLLIQKLSPDILVKGGDYTVDTIVGAKEVLTLGGVVKVLSFVPGKSTSQLVAKMQS